MNTDPKKNEENEKAGVIPADDIKGSDADSAYTGDESSAEELAAQQLGTDAEADNSKSKDK